jgi:osmoprotectant transport system permease protein
VSEQLALVPLYLSAHVRLTLAALAAGVALAVPAGVLASRVRWLEGPVLGVASVIQTIPALALLAAMVPLLSALGLPGIGVLPAFVGLVLYSLLPILHATVSGLHSVPASVVEAARGVGMTSRQRLLQVELPLALPLVVAGIRTAAVWTVGLATLATPVGATSLGNFIFAGLQTRNTPAILTGCVAAALLALLLDALVRSAAIGLRQRTRAPLVVSAAVVLALAGWAWSAGTEPAGAGRSAVRVGGKTFTEQYVLAEILAETARRAGREARVVAGMGSTVAFDALVRDEIDVYVDYTGTLWTTVMQRSDKAPERAALLAAVRGWLLERHGIVVAAPLGFENAYCFAVRRDTAESLALAGLADLAAHAPALALASDYEFFAREEWRAVQNAYHLSFRERRTMDPSLLYQAIAARQVDVITAYTTDGRIDALGLAVLADSAQAIPPYDAVVLVGRRLAREDPIVVQALAGLEGTIDEPRMRRLNRMVDEGRKSPRAAALAFFAPRRASP